MNPESPNAIAGPSHIRTTSSPSLCTPALFLPPPAQEIQSHSLSCTEDLIARFNLLPAYDKYVRPFTTSNDPAHDASILAVNGGLDKGKGKEVVDIPRAPAIPDGGDGDDDDGAGGKGDKKKKNNYRHLIKGVPGKHSFRKDEYLWTMMQIPPKQRMPIQPFDAKTQQEAFTVSLEGLKGWNPSALILESPQAREDRKKRKELKRLQKLQAQTQAQAALITPVAEPLHAQAALPAPAVAAAPLARAPPPATSVIQRPASTVSRPGSTIPPARPSIVPLERVSTPLKTEITGGGIPVRATGAVAPTIAAVNPYLSDLDKRGIKRDRDEMGGSTPVNPVGAVTMNGNLSAHPPKAIINAKAGMPGVRPRPFKKQRTDIQGQANISMIQQPTPQGV